MNKKFKVGKKYECANRSMGNVIVLNRVGKKIHVTDGKEEYTAVIKIDKDGDEFIQKTNVPLTLKGIYTYSADWEV